VYTLRYRNAKNEFRVVRLRPKQGNHTTCASQKFKSELRSKEPGKGYFDSRSFARC
jgi:hypothetical protein